MSAHRARLSPVRVASDANSTRSSLSPSSQSGSPTRARPTTASPTRGTAARSATRRQRDAAARGLASPVYNEDDEEAVVPAPRMAAASAKGARQQVKSRLARTGTLFGGSNDATSVDMQMEIAAAYHEQHATVDEEAEVGREEADGHADALSLELDIEPVPALTAEEQAEHDALSEEEWERRVGIRAPLPNQFQSTIYHSVDDAPVARMPSKKQRARRTGITPPDSSRPHLLPPMVAVPALTPTSQASVQLHAFDFERRSAPLSFSPARIVDESAPRQPAVAAPPTLSSTRLAELQHRALQFTLPQPLTPKYNEEKEQQRPSRAPARPSIAAPLPPSSNGLHAACAQSAIGQRFMEATTLLASEVLTPRSRYTQLGSACDKILPDVQQRPSTAATLTELAGEMHRQVDAHPAVDHLPVPAPNSLHLHGHLQSGVASPLLLSSRSGWSQASESPRNRFPMSPSFSRALSHDSESPMGSPAAHGSTTPNPRWHQTENSDAQRGERHMASLRSRALLPAEFLEEAERLTSPAGGISTLSLSENTRCQAGLAIGSQRQYSSAALLAAQEVSGVQLLPSHSHAHVASARRNGSPERAHSPSRRVYMEHQDDGSSKSAASRLPVDPQLAEVAAAAQWLVVNSTHDPSPVAGPTSHRYIRSYALHHHLPLAASSSSLLNMPAAAQGDADRVGLDMHLVARNGFDPGLATAVSPLDADAPLPSSSPALHLTSPSAHPDWKPPSVQCGVLTEAIWASSKSLSHIISSGEGRDAHERHLESIRPPRISEAMRKRAMAEAAVASIQAAAASKQAKQVRDAQQAQAAAFALKQEKERAAKAKAKAARNAAAAAASGDPAAVAALEALQLEAQAAEAAQQRWSKLKSSSMTNLHEDAPAATDLARTGSIGSGLASSASVAALSAKPVRFSRHRVPPTAAPANSRTAGLSVYGPNGENIAEKTRSWILPASLEAGVILDRSVAAASDGSGTSEQRRIEQLQAYTATLARLYRAITPQQKRLRRLDAPKASRDDVRRVVEECLGTHNPNAVRRAY